MLQHFLTTFILLFALFYYFKKDVSKIIKVFILIKDYLVGCAVIQSIQGDQVL